MTIPNFQERARMLAKPGEDILASLTPAKCELWHAASAAGGEAGELFDCVKKHVLHGKPLDRAHVVEELGDLKFFIAALQNCLSISDDEINQHNHHKLKARYPSGSYSDADAQARADKA